MRGDRPGGILARALAAADVSCELELPGGRVVRSGSQPPASRVVVRDGAVLDGRLTELRLGDAYVRGAIDVDGDFPALLGVREALRFGLAPSAKLRFAADYLLRPPARVNRQSIGGHYTFGDDFYLTFVDRRYRLYSQCLFAADGDTLEDAAERKLESMWSRLDPQPGTRLLDIGGGWGGVTQYCVPRGLHVTSLTLTQDSAAYIRALIADGGLAGDVVVEDVLEHRPAEPYDHAVMHGVIEHIPNYRRFCERLWDLLTPGGRLYLDASAAREKFAISPFSRKYIWPGTHCFMALQDLLGEALLNGFEIVEVQRETRDYQRTIEHWARRLDAAHDEIAERWSEELYRAFRVYLWGGWHALGTNRLQAYHVVLERHPGRGPRPGAARRAAGFVGSLR
jgi:cyclopropane-fatty-acyl-phospholipid synthase